MYAHRTENTIDRAAGVFGGVLCTTESFRCENSVQCEPDQLSNKFQIPHVEGHPLGAYKIYEDLYYYQNMPLACYGTT